MPATDLDRFYSVPSVDMWRAVLGEELHYHNGFFLGPCSLETGLRRTVENFYAHIPERCTILDAGCGWGGPARMLVKERDCHVSGVTISRAQAEYCLRTGLSVRLADLEDDPLSGDFDVAFLLESLSHIRGKQELLRRLRSRAKTLIVSVNCVADGFSGERLTFGGSMELCTPAELEASVTQAGWRIVLMRDRRKEALPTLFHWQRNIKKAFGDEQPPGQLGVLRDMTEHALRNVDAWSRSYPLIDIVAE
ncbi:MAG: SAM-dependent methyltransferase [Propylenella sp.]